MKTRIIILSAALVAGSMAGMAKSPKRGVSENSFSMGSMMEALEPGVGWYYNWANVPGRGYQDEVINFEGMEFVPMVWNGNYNADNIRNYVKSHPNTKYLLGFNEPNFTKQANMTPAQAAELWPAVKDLADELGLQLVAPALNYSPNPPYNSPTKWMDEFVELVGLDAFDFTAVHNYGGLGVMKQLAGDFHDRYGKPVWVTEFCYWPNEGDQNSMVTPETQISSMIETVEWLEKTDWIFRYAWFKPIGNSNSNKGPNYGLLEHPGGGMSPWTLTDQGVVYTYMPDFDADAKSPVGDYLEAYDYLQADKVGLGRTADSSMEKPLEINRFNSGASVDYRFDVPASGTYTFTLRVGGQGEPTRFDPRLAIFTVDEEGNESMIQGTEKQFPLPGDGKEYCDENFQVELGQGDVTLRVKDMAPYQPSGIRISKVKLGQGSDVAEITVEKAVDDNAIYSLTGVRVGEADTESKARRQLPKGIYIWRGKKIAN